MISGTVLQKVTISRNLWGIKLAEAQGYLCSGQGRLICLRLPRLHVSSAQTNGGIDEQFMLVVG